jgi:serine protease Do
MTRFRYPAFMAPLALAATLAVAMPAPARAQAIPDLPNLIDKLLPSVVNISMYNLRKPAADAPPGTLPEVHRKFGSGFIVHESGIIVTNKHVAEDGIFYIVRFADGRARRATLIAEAVGIDLAAMKIEGDEKWPALSIGDSDKLRRGDAVLAIGNPLGWSSSASTGIISALDRSIGSGGTDNFLQTDAAINQGNSGGPMFNAKGEVVGINSAILTTTSDGGNIGMGFAIPINDAKFVIKQLVQYGQIRIGWLGMDGQSVEAEMAATFGITGAPSGVIISSVVPDSPAGRAGVQVGDVVLTLNGRTQRNIRDLRRYTAEAEPGEKVKLDILRDGKKVALEMISAPFPDQAALKGRSGASMETAELPSNLGFSLSEMTDALRAQYSIPSTLTGLVVTDIVQNSMTWNKDIRIGDVIQRVQNDPVKVPADLRSRVDAARAAGHDVIRMLVTGKKGTRWEWVFIATKV